MLGGGLRYHVTARNGLAVRLNRGNGDRQRKIKLAFSLVFGLLYENWVSPGVVGNGGGIFAEPQVLHEFTHSAALAVPANSVLVFAR